MPLCLILAAPFTSRRSFSCSTSSRMSPEKRKSTATETERKKERTQVILSAGSTVCACRIKSFLSGVGARRVIPRARRRVFERSYQSQCPHTLHPQRTPRRSSSFPEALVSIRFGRGETDGRKHTYVSLKAKKKRAEGGGGRASKQKANAPTSPPSVCEEDSAPPRTARRRRKGAKEGSGASAYLTPRQNHHPLLRKNRRARRWSDGTRSTRRTPPRSFRAPPSSRRVAPSPLSGRCRPRSKLSQLAHVNPPARSKKKDRRS